LGPVVGDAAGLVRFDQILGIDLFTTNYQISPVTLGAIPSMHAGFATLGCFYAFRVNKKLGSVFAVYVACMYFAALYLQHHYMIDAVLGSFYALLACLAVEWVFSERVGRINEKIWQCFYRDAARPLWIKNTARGK
jgi:membrane-associated phospholipid phosphatase